MCCVVYDLYVSSPCSWTAWVVPHSICDAQVAWNGLDHMSIRQNETERRALTWSVRAPKTSESDTAAGASPNEAFLFTGGKKGTLVLDPVPLLFVFFYLFFIIRFFLQTNYRRQIRLFLSFPRRFEL